VCKGPENIESSLAVLSNGTDSIQAVPRVAYFPDSFHEINGVAHTSRNFVAYAERRGLPMLCVRAGKKTRAATPSGGVIDGTVEGVSSLELGRSPLSVRMEQDLSFDPLFFRYSELISRTVRAFKPDVIHITGPSELGIFGAYFAWQLGIPLAASWHTNVHEYAGRRMRWLSRHMGRWGADVEQKVEKATLLAAGRFYSFAKVLYAPNPELCALLEKTTSRTCHLMQRGVDTVQFTPARRSRAVQDGRLVLGFVGRLSVEKNVALLPKIDKALALDASLRARGVRVEWMIVGHGAEEAMLRSAIPPERLVNGRFAGVLRGEELAAAYADMDLLVFPSHTDTFGNVVLEALASGVPALVTPDGGPAHIVRDGLTGRIATDAAFADAIIAMTADAVHFSSMRRCARQYAMTCSWDAVFDRVVAAYPSGRVRTVESAL
jgi:phosphatidylinositol alpha 1,6-mannosyltransferase